MPVKMNKTAAIVRDRKLEPWEVGSRQPDNVRDAQENALLAAFSFMDNSPTDVEYTGDLYQLFCALYALRHEATK